MKFQTIFICIALTALIHSSLARRRCSKHKPCKRGRRGCRGNDNACQGDLICLKNNRCGSASDKQACTRRKKCKATSNRRCSSHLECQTGSLCRRAIRTGENRSKYRTCVSECPETQQWVKYSHVQKICGNSDSLFGGAIMPPRYGAKVPEGCGCLPEEYYNLDTKTCTKTCEQGQEARSDEEECPSFMVHYQRKPCQRFCNGESAVCAAVVTPGCACPNGTLPKRNTTGVVVSCEPRQNCQGSK
mmetsp:Transcript_1734/g.2609  ORF Transcript_1734/g.2609 Transcript_1734/m.2609 type:complete len:245 (+) Transcript_1734:876-1610(+)